MELKKKHDKALEDLFDTGIEEDDFDAKMNEAASDGSDESRGADNENELLDGEDDEFA